MLALALCSAVWAGYETVTFCVVNKWQFLTRLFSGIPIGLIYQSFFAFILQRFLEWNYLLGIVVISICIMMALFFRFLSRKNTLSYVISYTILDIAIIVSGICYMWIRQHKIYLEFGLLTRGCAWSDFCLHFQMINSFVYGCNSKRRHLFDMVSPFSAQSHLAYPIFPNFHAAYLMGGCGVSLRRSLRLTAFMLGASLVFQVHSFAMTLTSSHYSAAIAVPLWFFTGGLGSLQMFDYDWRGYNGKTDFMSHYYGNQHAYWFQSMTNIFNPQRCSMFAIPLILVAIHSLLIGISKFEWKYFFLSSLCVAVSPQTQAHAYLSIAIYSLTLAIITFPYRSSNWKQAAFCWVLYGVLANLIALPLAYPLIHRSMHGTGFLRSNPMWTNPQYTHSPHKVFRLWWPSLGVFGAIAFVGGFIMINQTIFVAYIPALVVFVVANLYAFQPWELDNTKVLHSGFFPLALIVVSNFFDKLWNCSGIFMKIVLTFLFFMCNVSGIVNQAIIEHNYAPLLQSSFITAGNWIIENTSPDTMFQASRTTWVPSIVWAGRKMFYGSRALVNTHGVIDPSKEAIADTLERGVDPELSKRMGVFHMIYSNLTNEYMITSYDDFPWWDKVYEYDSFVLWRLFEKTDKKEPNQEDIIYTTKKDKSKKKRKNIIKYD